MYFFPLNAKLNIIWIEVNNSLESRVFWQSMWIPLWLVIYKFMEFQCIRLYPWMDCKMVWQFVWVHIMYVNTFLTYNIMLMEFECIRLHGWIVEWFDSLCEYRQCMWVVFWLVIYMQVWSLNILSCMDGL